MRESPELSSHSAQPDLIVARDVEQRSGAQHPRRRRPLMTSDEPCSSGLQNQNCRSDISGQWLYMHPHAQGICPALNWHYLASTLPEVQGAGIFSTFRVHCDSEAG